MRHFSAPFVSPGTRRRQKVTGRKVFIFLHFANLAKVDILLRAKSRGSRPVNHTSYTFTAAGTQRRLARVQLDLRRVCVETFVCRFSYAREHISLPARSRREGISRVQTRIYYVMHTAACLTRSLETPAIITCTCSFSRSLFQRPLLSRSLPVGPERKTHTRTHSVSIRTWEKELLPADLQCAILLYRFSLALAYTQRAHGPRSGMTRF